MTRSSLVGANYSVCSASSLPSLLPRLLPPISNQRTAPTIVLRPLLARDIFWPSLHALHAHMPSYDSLPSDIFRTFSEPQPRVPFESAYPSYRIHHHFPQQLAVGSPHRLLSRPRCLPSLPVSLLCLPVSLTAQKASSASHSGLPRVLAVSFDCLAPPGFTSRYRRRSGPASI